MAAGCSLRPRLGEGHFPRVTELFRECYGDPAPRLDAVSAPVENRWPGERLGLPEAGPRSIARPARRIAALVIDWAIASAISVAFFSTGPWQTNGFVTLGLFAGIQLLFLLVLNGGVGHLLLGMRVVPLDPGRLAPWRALVRTLLVCLFVPAVIWDADQRGLHDRLAGTLLVRV
jgi:hypothetical protein